MAASVYFLFFQIEKSLAWLRNSFELFLVIQFLENILINGPVLDVQTTLTTFGVLGGSD